MVSTRRRLLSTLIGFALLVGAVTPALAYRSNGYFTIVLGTRDHNTNIGANPGSTLYFPVSVYANNGGPDFLSPYPPHLSMWAGSPETPDLQLVGTTEADSGVGCYLAAPAGLQPGVYHVWISVTETRNGIPVAIDGRGMTIYVGYGGFSTASWWYV
jgi:hypothetical protein